MEGAGKDCTSLFNKYHRWVNCESILGKCLLGSVASEEPSIAEDNEEDEKSDVENLNIESARISPKVDDVISSVVIEGQVSIVEATTTAIDSSIISSSHAPEAPPLNIEDNLNS
jgi:hypothetical protein